LSEQSREDCTFCQLNLQLANGVQLTVGSIHEITGGRGGCHQALAEQVVDLARSQVFKRIQNGNVGDIARSGFVRHGSPGTTTSRLGVDMKIDRFEQRRSSLRGPTTKPFFSMPALARGCRQTDYRGRSPARLWRLPRQPHCLWIVTTPSGGNEIGNGVLEPGIGSAVGTDSNLGNSVHCTVLPCHLAPLFCR